MKSTVKVAITGGSVWGNRGAEAMLMTTIAEIRKRKPDAEFYVFTVYPNRDRQLLNDEKIHLLNGKPLNLVLLQFPFAILSKIFKMVKINIPVPAEVRALSDSDMLLDIGGITFADGRTVFLLYNVFTIWPAMILGVPVIKLAQAMGPFNSKVNNLLAKFFLNRVEYVFSRGRFTSEHLEKLPLYTEKWEQAADIAFLYRPEYSLSQENETAINDLRMKLIAFKEKGGKIVAISPSSLVLNKSKKRNVDYIGKIFGLIRHYGTQDIHFVFFPNGSRSGSESARNNDIVAIKEFYQRAIVDLPDVAQSKIDWVDYDINTRSVRQIIEMSDVLISSRFHSMVAGLSLCVPTMVVGWSHKYQETLLDFDLATYAVDFEDESMDLARCLHELLQKNWEIRKQLEISLQKVKSTSKKQFDYLESKYPW